MRADCGTDAGYYAHRYRKEEACDRCKFAHAQKARYVRAMSGDKAAYIRVHEPCLPDPAHCSGAHEMHLASFEPTTKTAIFACLCCDYHYREKLVKRNA